MADAATDLLGLRLPEVGVKTDWGGTDGLNETIQMAEYGARGRNAIALTGNLTLDATNFEDHTDHYRYNTLIFSDGGLSSQPTITAPDKAIWWFIKNTGSTYDLTFKCSGTGVTIPQGRMVVVFSDGTDCELFDPVALAITATAADVVAAAASASAASTSASNAATSETNAATSETNAATSETNAATSESNAATSETNAAASAAGVNLPAITGGDASKLLAVKGDETGYEHTVGSFVPSGVIAIWSGSTGTIPSGWVICDGTNSTPDLRNLFVVGAGDTYAVGATGGAATDTPAITVDGHTLTESEMPAHTHDVASTNHSYLNYGGSGSMASTAATKTTTSTGGGGSHAHTASSAAVNTLPPYYALAYIMKS
jgi:hypothetical protein